MTLEKLIEMQETANRIEKEPEPIDPKLQAAIDKVHQISMNAYKQNKRCLYAAAESAENFLRRFESTAQGIRYNPWRVDLEGLKDKKEMWLVLELANIDIVRNSGGYELI